MSNQHEMAAELSVAKMPQISASLAIPGHCYLHADASPSSCAGLGK